jgi:hypothetical protein
MTESRKHSPRQDEALGRDADEYLPGAPHDSRAEESRETETPLEGEPEISAVPHADPQSLSEIELTMTPEEIDDRSRFGRYLPRSLFPAKRKELLHAAREAGAPDDVLDEIRGLPTDEVFETPARAWAALSHKIDQRF